MSHEAVAELVADWIGEGWTLGRDGPSDALAYWESNRQYMLLHSLSAERIDKVIRRATERGE